MVTTDFHTVHRAKILAHTLTLDFIILNWGRAKVSMVLRPALRGIKPESVLSSHRPRACWNTPSPLLSAASSPLFSAPSRPSREKRRLDLFRKETVVVQNFSLHAQKKSTEYDVHIMANKLNPSAPPPAVCEAMGQRRIHAQLYELCILHIIKYDWSDYGSHMTWMYCFWSSLAISSECCERISSSLRTHLKYSDRSMSSQRYILST